MNRTLVETVAETGNAETVIWLSSDHKAVYPEPGRFMLPPERILIGTHRNKGLILDLD